MPELNIPDEAVRPLAAFLWGKSAPLIVAAELERMADTPPEDGPWWALASSLRKHAADYRSMNPPDRKDCSNEPR